MILEIAHLNVKSGETGAFEAAFRQAQSFVASTPGYISHELQRCLERPNHYALLVRRETIRRHFYDPFPTVEHYELIAP